MEDAKTEVEDLQRVLSAVLTALMTRAGPGSPLLRETLQGARKIVAGNSRRVELVDDLETAFCGRLNS